jgi:hypothetical protein
VFLADGIGRGLVQVRISGSALAGFAGMDLRGLPLSCLFAAESRPLLAEVLEQVLSGQALAELDLGADRGRTGTAIARLLLLPLADAGGRAQVLGVLGMAEGPPGRCKLQILARRTERLVRPAAPAPDHREHAPPIARRGHLALVHSA